MLQAVIKWRKGVSRFTLGNTKQTSCSLKRKDRKITEFSRKEKKKKQPGIKRGKKGENLKLPMLSQLFGSLHSVSVFFSLTVKQFNITSCICCTATIRPGSAHSCCSTRPITSSHEPKYRNKGNFKDQCPDKWFKVHPFFCYILESLLYLLVTKCSLQLRENSIFRIQVFLAEVH